MDDANRDSKNLNFEEMTPKTRAVLRERISRPMKDAPEFFSLREFTELRALTNVVMPQDDQDWTADIAGAIDTRLARGDGKGWRYDVLPPETQMYREALDVLDALSQARFQRAFSRLVGEQQIAATKEFSHLSRPLWLAHFWEDFLAEVTETYYAHPFAQISIGARGMMDAAPDKEL